MTEVWYNQSKIMIFYNTSLHCVTPSILKCKAFWFVLSQTIPSLTKFIEKIITF